MYVHNIFYKINAIKGGERKKSFPAQYPTSRTNVLFFLMLTAASDVFETKLYYALTDRYVQRIVKLVAKIDSSNTSCISTFQTVSKLLKQSITTGANKINVGDWWTKHDASNIRSQTPCVINRAPLQRVVLKILVCTKIFHHCTIRHVKRVSIRSVSSYNFPKTQINEIHKTAGCIKND